MAGQINKSTGRSTPPSSFQSFRSMNSNRFDEGYSEDTRSQSGSDMVLVSRLGDGMGVTGLDQDTQFALPEWLMNMTESERSEFAYTLLRSLRTSSIASLVEKLNPLLHLDPVIHLPPEITFQILSYLPPHALLRAATLSRAWQLRVIDSPLWRIKFRLEGWNANFGQVRAYEEAERAKRAGFKERKTRARTAEDMETEKPSNKKRLRERPLFGDGPSSSHGTANNGLPAWGEQHSMVEADDTEIRTEDKMEDISYHDTTKTPSSNPAEQTEESLSSPSLANTQNSQFPPTLLLPSHADPKINWQFLYKQKKRLEDNWDAGRFSNFQLPHPSHPEEAHTECVYTIQYSQKHLVSGSRDKTIRVWNLETQRLIYNPLVAHNASVLCLQFDDRKEQDIIISGGSDNRIILWKFSTGEVLKIMYEAHGESILNLRFNDDHLVTCSKDKTIKVWNRKAILPTDDAYPSATTKSGAKFPPYIINVQKEAESSFIHHKLLDPYSLLMELQGHGAAVNAIQIYDGQIVSASGDRTVKVWDVRTGKCIRTFPGHTKGIACVQFDGRRIVSGSSDETVRIFDRATGAEVACLQGHTNLVRTVQAQFGDFPGNEEELEAEARAIDRTYFEAKTKGELSNEPSREQRRARNAGSRDPKAIFAYGAKLPPGGGGSKWARIVSGSYDETVIIWKRGPDGAWVKSRVLFQNEAVRAAGGRPRRPFALPAGNPNHAHHHNHAHQHPVPHHPAQNPNFQAIAQQAQQQAQVANSLAQQAQALHTATQGGQHIHATNTNGVALTNGNTVVNTNGASSTVSDATTAVAPTTTTTTVNNTTTAAPAPATQGPAPVAIQQPAQQPVPAHHHHHHHHHHHNAAGVALANQGTNSRVFKLQFDARRIICCSQDPTIVGWDFANGDEDIIMASQFFGESD